MNTAAENLRAQDLEKRIRVYEEMELADEWPGALSALDYTVIVLMTLVLVVGFYLWGY
ncbi:MULTISPECIES: hypothetical protein [Pseudomonas]|uniref:Uncharacterized protein n=1 Tax=Pseudomonas marincola TaxID=437900 RepID=A0A1I7B1R0_9PSED|nr:hypothetical protein [Pseudomonas marincola]CAE6907176.1 conserved protein of unknown function [Pseudomonas marincola]SFT81058.1 hypothetical protein SAMN05216264_104249 [Pseudomonas marincola]